LPRHARVRIAGIPLHIHWSWLLLATLFVWTLSTDLFPATYPSLSGSSYVAMASVATLLLLGSVLVHEVAHTVVALRAGMRIEGITLWLFGGVARFLGNYPSPGVELRVAAAGPLVSGLLAALFTVVAMASRQFDFPVGVRAVTDYLGRTNALLFVFNLVPAAPLDGGRLLHALLWRARGDLPSATLSSARVGQLLGALLAAVGLLGLLGGPGLGGLWFVFLGLFIYQAAQAEYAWGLSQQAVTLRVGDVMTPSPAVTTPDEPLDRLLLRARRERRDFYPVVRDGRLVGAVSVPEIVGRMRRHAEARVADVMVPATSIVQAKPWANLADVMPTLSQSSPRAVVIDDEHRVIGVLSTSDVSRALERAARGRARRGRFASGVVLTGAVVLVALAVGTLYHPPYVVIEPGDAWDITGDISINGVPVQQPNGRYLATSVRLVQPNAVGLLLATLQSDREIVTVDRVIPRGVKPADYEREQAQVFDESRMLAAAAAARANGMPATVTGTGARVEQVTRGSPASNVLRVGDVIVSIDGAPVHGPADVGRVLGTKPSGTPFAVTVERNGQRLDVTVVTASLPDVAGKVGIGVVLSTRGFDVQLPFQITFRQLPVGGPSAGLAYALAITDLLDTSDDAQGRVVAATGTIDPDGTVGDVGGVKEKAVAVQRARARLFFVPVDEQEQARREGLDVRGVTSLDQAVGVLRTGMA
jgi:PDZ domain-containing secreted protein/Zn-dependent protease/CBS domain-containing protein